jgi:hypothetical protein
MQLLEGIIFNAKCCYPITTDLLVDEDGLDCLVPWQLVMFVFTECVIVVHPIAMFILPVRMAETLAVFLKTMIHFWCEYFLGSGSIDEQTNKEKKTHQDYHIHPQCHFATIRSHNVFTNGWSA